MSIIFVNSVFVKVVGGKNYSQLFFFASLASVVYYFGFALLGDKKAFRVYKVVIVTTLIASILCFMEQRVSALEPYNKAILYFFAISVVLVDLLGTTLGPVILQMSVNPAIFREVYQKIVTADLVARISAAALIWFLSMNHWLEYWYPFGWAALSVHFFLFSTTVVRLRHVESNSTITKDDSPVPEKIKKGIKFIISNDMVRVAMLIMIWSQVTKFVVEYVFYQAADTGLSSARQIAIFVSSTTMVAIVLALVLQPIVGKKITRSMQLSTLFSFQPLNCLIFAGIALVLPPFWPVVVLLVTYNVINRCIHLPVSRQCLVPVPRSQRATIVSLICICMSTATMLLSGTMTVMKEVLHFQDFLVVLLVLGSGIFFLITGLDSYYIRNLWSFFREARSGRWQDEQIEDSLSVVELDVSDDVETPGEMKATADIKSHPILESYATSFDKDSLSEVTDQHRALLKSKDSQLALTGLRICFVTGFPWFSSLTERSSRHSDPAVREFAKLAAKVNSEFSGINGYSSVFVRRIKGLALEFYEDANQSINVGKLKRLLAYTDRSVADSIVGALSDSKFKNVRQLILSCITDGGDRVSLAPLLSKMYESNYESANQIRELLQRLPFGKQSPDLRTVIEENLSTLHKEKLALHAPSDNVERDAAELQRFMHTLFAEEYRLSPHDLDRALTDTIQEFPAIPAEDRAMLVDMHLEFLKRSEKFRSWQALMA
ncbi:MAG: hypothetical protein SGJ27_20880 [Candidatus Melainabacteria bacterium]|nr:hypothetical protein [Candidatus Melainabacteria bacterium]